MHKLAAAVSRPILSAQRHQLLAVTTSPSRVLLSRRAFSTSEPKPAKNQILNNVRNTDQLHTYLTLSASSRIPLITFWTASWCPSCRQISPLLQSLIESGVGKEQGSVLFAPVAFDSPDNASLGSTYMITSIPTLLSFDAGEAQTETKVADVAKLADRRFLVDWICKEASRGGNRGGGGGSLFGGLANIFTKS